MFREGDRLFTGFVARRGDAVFGYIDRCPHAGLPLAGLEGQFLTREGGLILCSHHAALFRIEDGYCIAGPCAGRSLWPWAVTVADGEVRAG
jgi:nitrite reductase/ring-hydroxylating ferredoxin subunit